MEDFHKLSPKIDELKKEQFVLEEDIENLTQSVEGNRNVLDDIEARVQTLCSKMNVEIETQVVEETGEETDSTAEINDLLYKHFKAEQDRAFEMNKVDILVACLAGGLASLADFVIVRTPKDITIGKGKDAVKMEGSPLTALLRKIGVTEDGKEAKWIKSLEKMFPVCYDKSVAENIERLNPRNHRIFSLGHDFSPVGLLFGVKDIVCGTFSYIDGEGVLRVDKVAPTDVKKLFYAPILWLGHLLSDVFTKAGLPIPGGCLLRTLQFGSFGEKERTIGRIVEAMYYGGYDLRHFATASVSNAIMELIIRLYMILIGNIKTEGEILLSEKEYTKIMNKRKLHNLLMIASSIAVSGNIAKLCVYQGNAKALNIPLWCAFAKESLHQVVKKADQETNDYINVIQNRHFIDESFEQLLQ